MTSATISMNHNLTPLRLFAISVVVNRIQMVYAREEAQEDQHLPIETGSPRNEEE